VSQRLDALRERSQLSFRHAALGRFIAEPHFNKDGQALLLGFSGGIQFLRNCQAIDGIYAIKQVDCPPRLVALQVADQVPCRVKPAQHRVLRLELLHAILAKLSQPRVVGRTDQFYRKGFRHCYDGDLIGPALSAPRRTRDPLAHPREIRSEKICIRHHRRDSSTLPISPFADAVAASNIHSRWSLTRSSRQSSSTDPALPNPRLAYAKLPIISMPARGKFIILEGIDGSGKRTQLELLARAFTRQGIAFSQISFPNYAGFFGKMVAQFLNGDFGPLAEVDPHLSALLYACDRLESKAAIDTPLASGKILVADRYVASNFAHQGARVPLDKRAEFLAWLKKLEYGVHGLPVEDFVIYLRLPVAEAHRLVGRKAARDYTKLHRDLQEADLAHLEAAARIYDDLAKQPNWLMIECVDAESHALRAPEAIHQEILAAIEVRVFAALGAKG
jgi:dTMP kinase